MKALANRFRWIGTALVLLALVMGASTAAVATTAAPAQAFVCAGYLPVYGPGGQIIGWICIPVEVEIDICPGCPDWAIGFDHLVLPEDARYVEDLAAGLGLLDRAASAGPREAAGLRADAQQAFLTAARRLGDNRVRLGEVGAVDWERDVIRPEPAPWLEAAGTDVGNGLSLMQAALADPQPDPWLAAAMREFDEAYLEIVHQEPVGY
jgi:hypothetical protein